MKHWAKKLLGIVLCAAMVLPVCGVAMANNPVATGNCGASNTDNVTWVLTGEENNYTLTISGTGEMADYGGNNTPWYNYTKKSITSTAINGNVLTVPAGDVTVVKDISYTITFKMDGGKWSTGSSEDIKETVSRKDNEDLILILKPEQIPTPDGPTKGYKEPGSWDVDPAGYTKNGSKLISKDMTFTYSYTPRQEISKNVTFKVANGSWNDGKATDITVKVTGYEGDTLKLKADQIPGVGSKPAEGYRTGAWDVTPSADTPITKDTTYTFTYTKEDAAVVTTAPTAKTGLVANGSAQELVTAGEASGGTVHYSLGSDGTTAPESGWGATLPVGTDAGTYYAWYKAVGDADHADSAAACVTVTITDPVHVHTPEKIPGKAATCTEDGLTDGEKCSTCGAILTAQEVIPATGHKPDGGTVTREPTASEPGIRTYCCTVCGAKLYDEEIPYTVYLGWTGWRLVNGGWYYGDSAGYALIGTHAVDGVVYHFGDTGEMVSGWKQLSGKWFHATTSGALSYGGWEKINNVWYYFRENGEMATGWVNDRGTWYYLRDNGSMAVGWVQDNGKWYYTDKNGAMRTGWLKDGNIWYYLADDGHMVTEGSGFRPSGETGNGWVQDGGRWYYVGNNGGMATGWLWDGENWYYLDKNGAMVTGWLKDGKTWYYLHADGKMATGWITDGGLRYYLRESGAMATGWICVDDYWYYMNPNGAMATGWLKDGNTWYWLDSEGHMVTGEVMIDGQINVFADSGAWLYAQ